MAEKIYSDIDEKLTDTDDTVYRDYKHKLSVRELYETAVKWFVQDSRRITIEMFPGLVTDKEREFVMERNYSLTGKNYELVTIDDLVRMKFESK